MRVENSLSGVECTFISGGFGGLPLLSAYDVTYSVGGSAIGVLVNLPTLRHY